MSTRSYHLLFVLQGEAKGPVQHVNGLALYKYTAGDTPHLEGVCCLSAGNKQHGKENRYAEEGEVSGPKSLTEPETPSS